MKFLILLTFFITFSISSAYSNAKILFTPKKELPLEFQYLVESIQQYQLTLEEEQAFKKNIKQIDGVFSRMSPQEIEFTTKSEILKTFLKPPKTTRPFRKNISQSFSSLFEKEIVTSYEGYNPFATWIIKSVASDLKSIKEEPDFTAFAKNVKSGKELTKKNQKKLYKKLSSSYSWYMLTKGRTPEEFNQFIFEELFSLLDRITKYSIHFIRVSKFETQISPPKELIFFSIPLKPQPEKKTPKSRPTTGPTTKLDKLIDPIIEKEFSKKERMAKRKLDRWRPRDTVQLPPKYPTPDPSYIPPNILPSPLNEWPEDVVILPLNYPTPNPNYVPPDVLPRPLDKWPGDKKNFAENISKDATDPDEYWILD